MHTSSGQDAKRKKEGGPLLEMFFSFFFSSQQVDCYAFRIATVWTWTGTGFVSFALLPHIKNKKR